MDAYQVEYGNCSYSFLVSGDFCCLSIRTDKMPVLVWIQTVSYSNGNQENKNLLKKLILKKKPANDYKSMKNYEACIELNQLN